MFSCIETPEFHPDEFLRYNQQLYSIRVIVPIPILQAGEPVLRQEARPLQPPEIFSKDMRNLIDAMRESMRAAPGVGLAAPQIGYGIQLAVIEDRQEYTKDWTPQQLAERDRKPVPFHVIINPRLTVLGEARAEFFEGCLSVAGLMALVRRTTRVRVECLDEKGKTKVLEATGWYARILQHEIDHLHGTLYVDHMNPRTLMTVENYKQHWAQKTIEQIRAALGCGSV